MPARLPQSVRSLNRSLVCHRHLGEDAAMLGLKALDLRSDLIESEQFITGDRYLFIRSAYLQSREYLVNDGQAQDEFEDEFGIFDE